MQPREHAGENVIVTQTRVRIPLGPIENEVLLVSGPRPSLERAVSIPVST